ncbi:MAG: hypothetical protein ACRDQ0_15555 [Pseudonocardia sp.]
MAITKAPAVDPHVAVEQLRDALTEADIVLPSLAADTASPRLRLVHLGSVRADVAAKLARAIRDGGDCDGQCRAAASA